MTDKPLENGPSLGQQRYCPLCERLMMDRACPDDGSATILVELTGHAVDLPAGTIIAGRYRIDDPLGAGGMAKVFRATQISMQRPVAIKVLQPALLHDLQHVKRFYREARAASQLSHPNIVNVHDFGVDDDKHTPFIAMELIEGRNLGEILEAEGSMGESRVCVLMAQVARALVEAHANGVVHRDLKPENIMVSRHRDESEHVKVLDFGIAKISSANNDGVDSLTASGVALGTPRYMAPEQVFGDRVDLRADLYALGCILHELLMGRPPYEAEKAAEVMLKHVHEPAPQLPSGIGSPGLRALHDTLLRKQPEDRSLTTAQVSSILSKLSSEGPGYMPPELAQEHETAPPQGPSLPHPPAGPRRPPAQTESPMAAPTVPRRSWGAVLALVGAVVAVIVLSITLLTRSKPDIAAEPLKPEESLTVDAPGAPEERTAPGPGAPADGASKTLTAEPETPAEAPPDRREVVVRLTSKPAGARVFVGRRSLGKTPLNVRVRQRGRTVTLRLKGYEAETRTLTPQHTTGVHVPLRAKRKAPDDFPPLAPR